MAENADTHRSPTGVEIHHTACIDPSAHIGEGVRIGPWVEIGPNVKVGDHTTIASHVVIVRDTSIGQRNNIHSHAVLGGDPQDLNYTGEKTALKIGDDNVIREFVTINRGTSTGRGLTTVGHKNMLLAYAHIAHDCDVKHDVLMVNNASIAGHVTIEPYAILGAFTAVHQFCRVGAYSFLSQATEVAKDIPPFMLVRGIPGYPCGLNLVGLKRRGFSSTTLRDLKTAYKILYTRGLKYEDAKSELTQLADQCPEVGEILHAINISVRGIARRAYARQA